MQKEIYVEFESWLDSLLENNKMPAETAAFNFNLYEESTEDHVYSIQLIAADTFDSDDSDWACEEVWSSEENIFLVDTSDEQDTEWKYALQLITEMCSEYLENGKYKNVLRSTQAVGIGFVDGDIDIIYKA